MDIHQTIHLQEEITRLNIESETLIKQLGVSLAIQKMWPEGIFPIKSRIRIKNWINPKEITIEMKDSDNKEKIFSIKDVPDQFITNLDCYDKIKEYRRQHEYIK